MLCSACVDPLDALLDLEGVAAELLAQRQRRRVLGVGAADLDDVLERRRLVDQRAVQLLQRPAASPRCASIAVAMCIAVGKVSFDDWPMLTWSFGCTGFFEPISPPSISIARFEITSLAFMLDWVPEPVCQTTSGKWSSSLPSTTSAAAADDRRAERRVEVAELDVHVGRGLLDRCPSARHDRHRLALPADREVLDRALGLRAPVAVGGNLQRAEAVGFGARARSSSHTPLSLCAPYTAARRGLSNRNSRRRRPNRG